jgi:hypothetical protein
MPKITRIPLLFLAGEQDEVIPHIHMKQLWEATERAPEKSIPPNPYPPKHPYFILVFSFWVEADLGKVGNPGRMVDITIPASNVATLTRLANSSRSMYIQRLVDVDILLGMENRRLLYRKGGDFVGGSINLTG